MSFAVGIIAPATDRLGQDEPRRHHIGQLPEIDSLDPGKDPTGNDPADHAALDGQAAFSDIDDRSRVLQVVVEIEQNIPQPGHHHCRRDDHQDKIIDQIGLIASLFSEV